MDTDSDTDAALALAGPLAGPRLQAALEAVSVTGPRRWWGGPLDVEGLALGSVRLAAASLGLLLGDPARLSLRSARVAAAFNSSARLRIDGRASHGFAPLSRFWPTADGWLRTHANYPHHAARLAAALGLGASPDVRAVGAALAELTSAQAERLIVTAGGVAAAVRSRVGFAASAEGVAAGQHAAAPLQWDASAFPPGAEAAGGPRWRPDGVGAGAPLAGLRVLDHTRVIAGPTATRLLAALGADVLRLNPPQYPELDDQHLDTDGGKRVVGLDLRDNAARLEELLSLAHVVVTGYRPGSLDALGLGADHLCERHPHLVHASLSAWGAGPWEGRRGFDSLVQAACGIAHAYRETNGHPGALPVQALDHATGQLLVAGMAHRLAVRAGQAGEPAGGECRAALAWTAEALWALPVPSAPVEGLGQVPPDRRERPTEPGHAASGILDTTPAPLDLDGEAPRPETWLEAPGAPPAFRGVEGAPRKLPGDPPFGGYQ